MSQVIGRLRNLLTGQNFLLFCATNTVTPYSLVISLGESGAIEACQASHARLCSHFRLETREMVNGRLWNLTGHDYLLVCATERCRTILSFRVCKWVKVERSKLVPVEDAPASKT